VNSHSPAEALPHPIKNPLERFLSPAQRLWISESARIEFFNFAAELLRRDPQARPWWDDWDLPEPFAGAEDWSRFRERARFQQFLEREWRPEQIVSRQNESRRSQVIHRVVPRWELERLSSAQIARLNPIVDVYVQKYPAGPPPRAEDTIEGFVHRSG
jgi:hypothetical protein